MKSILFIIAIFISSLLFGQTEKNFYNFEVDDIQGNVLNMEQFKGKKILVVNTASKCGLTPQYEELEKLYQTYKDENFIIIGFPANNFLKQEPGTNNEIAAFCHKNYGVTFPMMSKISVKGNSIHPLYQWLTQQTDSKVQWNFQKYMINENGEVVGYVSPKTKPFDSKIITWIEQ